MQRTVRSLLKEKGDVVWSVAPDVSVYDAIKLMTDKQIGAVLVLAGEALVGMLTERDYMQKVILHDRASKTTRVEEIMTRRVIYVEPGRTVEECMALMTKRRIRHLPVLQDETLVGVVSIGDVVKAVIAARGVLIDQLERYIKGDHPT